MSALFNIVPKIRLRWTSEDTFLFLLDSTTSGILRKIAQFIYRAPWHLTSNTPRVYCSSSRTVQRCQKFFRGFTEFTKPDYPNKHYNFNLALSTHAPIAYAYPAWYLYLSKTRFNLVWKVRSFSSTFCYNIFGPSSNTDWILVSLRNR